MMVRPLSLTQHTLYADLLEQGVDDLFDPDLPENGSLLVRGNRRGASAGHAYYQGYRLAAGDAARGRRYSRYLGRADGPEVAAKIAQFQRIKAVRAERATTVRALIAAGMPRPDLITGRIIEALARVGLFPDNAVLLGDAAYQTYDGVLGVRLPREPCSGGATQEIAIAVRDRDRQESVLDALRTVDESFVVSPQAATTYRARNKGRIDVTLAERVPDRLDPTDFLLAHAVHALVLHGPGIPVSVPAPERQAACTLLEMRSRADRPLSTRRIGKARHLADALRAVGRDHTLATALIEASAISFPTTGETAQS